MGFQKGGRKGGFGGERKPWVPRNQNLKGTTPRIFIGNLNYDIDDDAAKAFFKEVGAVTNVHWATDRDSGDFKGFGFLTLESNDAVDKAVDTLQGKDLMGRAIRIDWAEERKSGGKGGGKGKTPDWVMNPASPKPDGCTQCFLGNLSFDIDEDTVREFFKDCGEIDSIRWVEKDGQFKGVGFITFTETEATDKAVAKNAGEIMGRACRVDFATGGKGGGGKDRKPDWDCPECGVNCFGSKPVCFKCGTPNPAGDGKRDPNFRPKERLPDWDCECGATGCFGSKPTCFKCGAQNPAIAAAEAAKPSKSTKLNVVKKSKKRSLDAAATTDEPTEEEVAPEPAAKKARTEDINPVVYQFLVQAGFKKAAKAFKKEAVFDEDEGAEQLLTIYSGYLNSKKRKLEEPEEAASPAKKLKTSDDEESKADDGSSTDEEEEEEEAAPVAAAASQPAEESSSDDSSDEEEEETAAPMETVVKAAPAAAEEDSDDSSDSSDDEEEAAQPAAKAAPTPVATAAADDEDSDSDSSSDDEEEDAAPAQPATPAPAAESSDSDSDSSDDEEEETTPAAQAAPAAVEEESSDSDSDSDDEEPAKPAPTPAPATTAAADDDSDSDSDSSDDEEEEATPAAKPTATATPEADSDSDSDSDSSE